MNETRFGPKKKSSPIYLDTFWCTGWAWNCKIIFRCASIHGRAGFILYFVYLWITKLCCSETHHRHRVLTNFLQTNERDILFCFVLAHVMLWRSILPLHRRETLNSKAAKQKAGLQKNKKSRRDCGVGLPQWNPQFNIRPMTFLHPDEDNVCRLLFVVIYLYI